MPSRERMIRIHCPHCQTAYQLNPEKLSHRVKIALHCPHCQQDFPLNNPKPTRQDAQVISLCNQKGGVSKTSSCLYLGHALSQQGSRVLLIDFDPQANLSQLLQCEHRQGFVDVLSDETDKALQQVIIEVRPHLWLLPANSQMAILPKRYLQTAGYERLLRKQLDEVKAWFDYVLIDTPPSMGFFTLNALIASDHCIVPTQAEFLSHQGIKKTLKMILSVSLHRKATLTYHLLMTQFDPAHSGEQVIAQQLQRDYGDQLLKTSIPKDNQIPHAQIAQKLLHDYAVDSIGAKQYQALAQEVASRMRGDC